MTEHPIATPAEDAGSATPQARVANRASRRSAKRRHPAQGARIAAAGIGATTMLGLVGVMGYAAHSAAAPAPAPAAQPQVVVVVHRAGAPDAIATPGAPNGRRSGRTSAVPSTGAAGATTLTARPTVRPASPQAQAPAASTSGSR